MKSKHLFAIAVVLYVLALMVSSTLTSLGSVNAIKSNDKVLHFVVFFILTVLLYWTFREYQLKYVILPTFLTVTILSYVNEYIQKLVPGRTFNPLDLKANMIGISLAVFLILIFRPKQL